MLVASLSLATLLLLWQWWWRMRRNPLYAAAQAIFDALADLPCSDDGPPSRRTRSAVQNGTSPAAQHGAKLVNERARARRERERVRHFARAVRSLPMRGGRAIRCVAQLKLQIPDVTWRPHRSGSSLLEHCDLLPHLQSVKDDAAAAPLHRCYAEQRHMRRRGNSYALWQMAQAGAVTLPHVDDDLNGITMGTYIAIVEGAQLIVAWRRGDLHEDEVLRDIRLAQPSLSRLESVPSLTILRAAAGDLIYMPKDTVHMVITEKRKVQLAYHVYE